MFNGNSSLVTIPDISIWKTDNLKEINEMFYGCSSLLFYPDISKWNYKFNKIKKEDFYSSSNNLNSKQKESYLFSCSDNSLSNISVLTSNNNLNDLNINKINNNINFDKYSSYRDELNDYYNDFYN